MQVRIIDPIKSNQISLKKVCAYVRVSTANISQGLSLENQTEYFERTIKANPEYEFVCIFSDNGTTGTKADRPEFQKMLSLAESGGIDIILTKSISRFARNTVDLLEIVRKLKAINVEVRFEEERINTLDGDGELMLTVLSSFAQEESKSVSDNIKWRFHKKFESGELLINATRFLGYDKNEYGELIINQAEAKIIERIYSEYLAGNGAFKISKILNSENIPTVTGTKWSTTTILDILKNEKYKGDLKLQKTYVKDHLSKKKCKNRGEVDSFYVEDNHSPIVTKEVWEQVQLLMISRAKAKGNIIGDREKYCNRYPLTGMLYCAICGAPLIRRTWSNKKIFWQCSNYIRNGRQTCTGTKIEDNVISNVNIHEPTVVREENKNGKNYYRYTIKAGSPRRQFFNNTK